MLPLFIFDYIILIWNQLFISIKEERLLMGRQINFYMSKSVQEAFIDYLCQNNFLFLNYQAEYIDKITSDNIFDLYLYKHNYGDIIICQDYVKRIDSLKSPVIEFQKTTIKENEKKVLRGRLWLLPQYYNDEGIKVKKEEALLKDYQLLVRWVKKNVPYQKIRKGDYYVNGYANDEVVDLQNEGFALTM